MLQDMGSWGYVVAGVSLDTKDFQFNGDKLMAGMQQATTALIQQANADQTSHIVLQHDFIQGTENWLKDFVAEMQGKGFRFVTCEECLQIAAYR